MLYTRKIQDAIYFAVKTHEIYDKQKRRGKDVPYITHPLIVGLILAEAGASEDVIVAGILHDTIEDSIPQKKVTKEMLEERFGTQVADLVYAVTEKNLDAGWHERKAAALEDIKAFSHDALLVKSADVISNTTEMLGDHGRDGEVIFDNFFASKQETLAHAMRVIVAILGAWPENPLRADLETLIENVEAIGGVVEV